MIRLQIVVIDLQCAVRSSSGESHYVILVVINFHANFADRMIVGAHVVDRKNVTFHLCARVCGLSE